MAVNAGDRHVDGNSVDAVIQSVAFQQGDAQRNSDLQKAAIDRQTTFDALGLKAQADTNVLNLQVQTYNPSQLPQDPGPMAAVQQAQQVQGPSIGSALLNVGSSLVGSYNQAVKNQSIQPGFSGIKDGFSNLFSAFKLGTE